MSPYVDKLAEEFQGKLKVVKLNTQDNMEVPAKYGKDHRAEALFVLGLISTLMISESLFEASHVAANTQAGLHAEFLAPLSLGWLFKFFNDTATTKIYTLSLHDALPISSVTTVISGAGTSAAHSTLIAAGLLAVGSVTSLIVIV